MPQPSELNGGCWEAGSMVLLANGYSYMKIGHLRIGDLVWTPTGRAKVLHVIEYNLRYPYEPMCQVKNLWITPYHPVCINGAWKFPAHLGPIMHRTIDKLYNLILDSGHIISISDVLSCTLGHGFTGDVIEHPYFGDMTSVLNDLSRIRGYMRGAPIFFDTRVRRNPITGLTNGIYDASITTSGNWR